MFSLHFHFAFFYTTKSSLLLLDEDVKWTDKCEHYVIGCVELKLRWEFIKENKKVRKKVILQIPTTGMRLIIAMLIQLVRI